MRFTLKRTPDRSVVLVVIAKAWNTLTGILTLFLVARRLSPEAQGYYYLLLSLGALQMFAELGLSVALTNLVSHEIAELRWDDRRNLRGPQQSLDRVQSLLKFGSRWFNLAAGGLAITLPLVGWIYLSSLDKHANPQSAFTPWLLYVAGVSVSLALEGKLSFLLGAGQSEAVSRCRLLQAVSSSIVIWGALIGGAGLWALGLSVLLPAIGNLVWIQRLFGNYFETSRPVLSKSSGIDWRRDVWPFQWKIGLSFLSGFFLSQIITPIVLRQHGPIAAGRFGLSLQVVTSINAIAYVWINTKAASYGALISSGAFDTLRTEFWKAAIGSSLLAAAGFTSIAAIVGSGLMNSLQNRVLPTRFFIWLCLLGFCNHIIFTMASFLRSLRTDPLWRISLVQGAVTTVVALAASRSPYTSALRALTLGTVAIGLPGCYLIFRRLWDVTLSGKNRLPN